MLSLGRVTVDICNNGPRETMAIRDSGEKVAVVVQILAGNVRRMFPARLLNHQLIRGGGGKQLPEC